MRSPDIALTNTEKTNALGAHTVVSYMDTITPTVVATALINQAAFTFPLLTLTVDGTVGWVGVKAGMDVYVGTTPGAQDIGVYRVKSSDATHLTIGETGQGDAGLLIVPLRSATFADNQYLTVVQRRSIWSVLPLISGANFYEDYNMTVGNFNAYPPPVLSILCALVSGARQQYNHLWAFVDDSQNYATITFTVSADAWPGTSVSSYAWTAPGSWTVTGGSVATATFTAQVPAQTANYELLCVVTNNHGVASTRVVEVWVKARTGTYAPLPITSLDRVTWDATGPQVDFTLNDNLLAAIPDGSMVVIAQERFFNGAVIASAVTQVVGWVTRIGQKSEPGLRTASPQFVGVNGLLNLKRGTSQVWAVATSITTWQQVPTALCTLSFAQFWLLSQRARGVLELFDFIPASLTATDQRLPRIDVKMGTPWSQLLNLADGYQKRVIACDPDGTLWVRQPPSLNPTYPRTSGAVVVRDTHDASIYHDVNWPRELYPKVGVVEGSAFTWDGVTVKPTPLLSLAPGFTPGQGGGDEKCENQVVDSQATLNTLTGNYFASLNPDYPEVTVHYEGMRGALIKPAQRTLVRIQIPDYLSPSGVALDRYAMPVEVNETYRSDHNGGLVVDTSIRYVFETVGTVGETKVVPVGSDNPYVPITFPVTPGPLVGLTALATALAGVNTDGYRYITLNLRAVSPIWARDAIPGLTGNLVDSVQDAFTTTRQIVVTDDAAGIYTVEDFTGTMATTLRKTLRAASVYRRVGASFGADFMVLLSFYGFPFPGPTGGYWYCYSLNGGLTWSAEIQVPFYAPDFRQEFISLWVSSRSPGQALISAWGASGFMELWQLSNNFATITPTGIKGNYPLKSWADNENTLYYGTADPPSTYRKIGGAAAVNITPSIYGQTMYFSQLHACPVDANTVMGRFNGSIHSTLAMSRDKGTTWTTDFGGFDFSGDTPFIGAEVAGDSADVGYLWGAGGNGVWMATADLAASTVTDRSGNLASFSPGGFVRIRGL